MIVFPPAKINLGLNVTERRADGYHHLETIFYPIFLQDILEVVCAADPEKGTSLHLSGNALEGESEKNIVLQAYRLLEQEYALPPVEIYLHKCIPSGAGLGGGSADGAYMIRLLNDLFALGLTPEQSREYAVRLGADCPFFIENKPSYATGIGEILTPVHLDLSSWYILLVKPAVFVSTAAAFRQIRPAKPALNVKEIIENYPLDQWRDVLRNDFEDSVFPEFPELARIKETLYESGAAYASMSGSGSSLYGIYKEDPDEVASLFPTCFTWWKSLAM